jgi:hypothetical protein
VGQQVTVIVGPDSQVLASCEPGYQIRVWVQEFPGPNFSGTVLYWRENAAFGPTSLGLVDVIPSSPGAHAGGAQVFDGTGGTVTTYTITGFGIGADVGRCAAVVQMVVADG